MCILRIYHVSPVGTLFAIIFIVSPSTPLVPKSPGVSISLCPVAEFLDTLICISFCFIVFGPMSIIPELLTLPSLLGITIRIYPFSVDCYYYFFGISDNIEVFFLRVGVVVFKDVVVC